MVGTLHREIWISEGVGRSRKERASDAYHYYLPTPLADLNVSLVPDVVGDITRAENAITKLNARSVALHSSEGLARLLLRAEAVSSSHIEGLSIGTRRLLRAEMNRTGKGSFKFDEAAADIVGNIHAMEFAVQEAAAESRVTVDTILQIHETLCAGTRIESFGGAIRTSQNWVGGNSYNPLQAEYIPPAPEHVIGLLEDLAAFCNDEVVSPVLQAALVHAQFESIHPFVDGNGRTGRALIHLILKRRGLAPHLIPPISLCMATHAQDYVEGLGAFRFVDGEDPEEAQTQLNDWVSFFAGACLEACEEAEAFEESARELQESWKKQLGSIRKGSALELLLNEMVGMPVFTIGSACEATDRTFAAMSPAVMRCVDAGIVKPIGSQKRNRAFEVPDVIDAFNLFERRLASPVGDTSIQKPMRPVPENLAKKR